jgi:hypothetical protein
MLTLTPLLRASRPHAHFCRRDNGWENQERSARTTPNMEKFRQSIDRMIPPDNQPSNPPRPPTTNRPLDDDDETRIGLAQFCVCTDMLSPWIGSIARWWRMDCKVRHLSFARRFMSSIMLVSSFIITDDFQLCASSYLLILQPLIVVRAAAIPHDLLQSTTSPIHNFSNHPADDPPVVVGVCDLSPPRVERALRTNG